MIVFRRRHVRVHQSDPAPSIEGVLVGKPWRNAGHYVIRKAGLVLAPGQTVDSDSKEIWVPRERVLFVEVIK